MTTTPADLDLIIAHNAERGLSDRRIADLDEPVVKLVVVRLGEGLFAFPGEQVREILPCLDIFLVPGCPPFVEGIINVRGDIDSVLNLHRVLGLADTKVGSGSRIVLGVGAGIRSGLRVDCVEDVLDVPESSIRPPLLTLPETVRPYVSGEAALERGSAALINLDALFGRLLS